MNVGLRSSVPARSSHRWTRRSGAAYGSGSTRAASELVKIAAAARGRANRQHNGRCQNGSAGASAGGRTHILQQRIHHSFLNAIIGSMRVARRAGK